MARPGHAAGAPSRRQERVPAPSLPLEVSSLLTLSVVGGVSLLASAAVPMSPQAPVVLDAALGGVALLHAAWLWARGARVTRLELHLGVLLGLGMSAAIVAGAVTGAGAAVAALGFFWVLAYAASALSRRATRTYAVLAAAALAWSLHRHALPGWATVWAVVTLSSVAATEIVGRLLAALRTQATTDHLTGLPDRSGLLEAWGRLHGRRRWPGCSLVVLDLDGFKQLNDAEGHLAGDRLLVDVTAAWRRALRPDDVLARSGGDEFVLLLPGADAAAVAKVLDRLRQVSCCAWSAGATTVRPGEPLDDCLGRADRCLYLDKAAGRAGTAARSRRPAVVASAARRPATARPSLR
jgi:diguanylate cyclase (GGDEF)-like protein